MRIKTDKVTLLWRCPTCLLNLQQPLVEIVENGEAICSDCDCDCDLLDEVEIKET